MDWQQALEAVEEGKIERFRWLCSDENPDIEAREGYRSLMIRKATGKAEPAPSYPSLAQQAWNASKAATGFVASGFKVADKAEQERRLAICHACEFYDAVRSRCRKCGCKVSLKARIETSHCPISKW